MISLLARLLLTALIFLAVENFVPGIHVANFGTAVLLAILWGAITLIIRPIIFVLTLPVNILTFGLFTLVINGVLFSFLAKIVSGFEVSGFFAAVLGALALSLFQTIIHWTFGRSDD